MIHFENGHHGSSRPLLIRTMSPKSKTMSPNLFQEEILNKLVNVHRQREAYSESELTLKVTIDRENSEVSQVPKKGGLTLYSFSIQH